MCSTPSTTIEIHKDHKNVEKGAIIVAKCVTPGGGNQKCELPAPPKFGYTVHTCLQHKYRLRIHK